MSWKINLKEDKYEDLGQAKPLAGWYLAVIDDCKENSETGNMEFDFRIKGPVNVGAVHKEFLNNPDMQPTEKATTFAIRKVKDWGKRLGVIKPDDCGKEEAELEWATTIGTEVVLHLKDDSYVNNAGKKVDQVRCDWAPYPLDHAGVPAEARQLLGLALLPGQTLVKDNPKPAKAPRGSKRETVGAGANGSSVDPSAIDVSDV